MPAVVYDCEQQSPEWWSVRLGIPTASRFGTVMAKGKTADGKKDAAASKTRREYMLKLVGERITGVPAESYSNVHMDRGHVMEPEARTVYAFMHDANPLPVGFIRNGEAGCSPDSLLSDVGLLEIKTKLPHLQIEVLLAGKLPPEHKPQVQGQLWIAEREWCDFVSYFPGLPLFVVRVHREEEYISLIEREVKAFLDELHATEFRVRQMDGSASTMQALRASLAETGNEPE